MPFSASPARYGAMQYRRCGRSGLKLPAISLGLWQNFGGERPYETSRAMVRAAFDLGITRDTRLRRKMEEIERTMSNVRM